LRALPCDRPGPYERLSPPSSLSHFSIIACRIQADHEASPLSLSTRSARPPGNDTLIAFVAILAPPAHKVPQRGRSVNPTPSRSPASPSRAPAAVPGACSPAARCPRARARPAAASRGCLPRGWKGLRNRRGCGLGGSCGLHDGAPDHLGHLGDYSVSEAAQSVHPGGNPISHSTHVGFREPPGSRPSDMET